MQPSRRVDGAHPALAGDAVLRQAVHLASADVHLQREQVVRRAQRQNLRQQDCALVITRAASSSLAQTVGLEALFHMSSMIENPFSYSQIC